MKKKVESKEVLACSYCGSENIWSRAIYLYKINAPDEVQISFKNFDHECDLDSFHCWGCNRTYKNEALIVASFFEEWA